MALQVILEHPDDGVVSPLVTGGSLSCRLDYYPRWQLTVDVRPALARGVELWETPYGTKAHVLKPDGSLIFTGHVYEARANQPDGNWTLSAADPTYLLSQHSWSELPNQHLAGTTMTVPAFITAMAAAAGVSSHITVTGSGGVVDVSTLDLSGRDSWGLIEEQLIGNALDVYPQPNGSLLVAPTAAMKQNTYDRRLRVGETGNITTWDVVMRRRINRIIVTHQAQKDGEEDRYLDGVWEDHIGPSGIPNVGPSVYTTTVRVGPEWWDNMAAHQAQANANAAAAAQTLRGTAREVSVTALPDYGMAVGQTVDIRFTAASRDRFLVTGVSWPLEPGVMTVNARNPDPGRLYGGPDPAFFRTEPRRHHARNNA